MLALAAGLWLAYLVPNWLRRKEFAATERNAVRLQQTIRVLAETSEAPVVPARRLSPPAPAATAPSSATRQRVVDELGTPGAAEPRDRVARSCWPVSCTIVAQVGVAIATGWSRGRDAGRRHRRSARRERVRAAAAPRAVRPGAASLAGWSCRHRSRTSSCPSEPVVREWTPVPMPTVRSQAGRCCRRRWSIRGSRPRPRRRSGERSGADREVAAPAQSAARSAARGWGRADVAVRRDGRRRRGGTTGHRRPGRGARATSRLGCRA